jgi:hypothetical protein
VPVFTNKPPCGPKRGHGTPQPRFALEVHLDRIAEELGLDPAEMRRRTVVPEHQQTVNHLTVTTCGLTECIDRVVEASGWREKFRKLPPGRGIGIAASAYLTGAGLPIYWNDMPHSGAMVKIDRGGGVAGVLRVHRHRPGLGLDPRVHRRRGARDPARGRAGRHRDTDLTPVDLGSYSSRVTLMTGNAARAAAEKLRGQVLAAAARKLGVPPEALEARDRRIFLRDDPAKGLGFDEAAAAGGGAHGTLVASGSYTPPRRAAKFKGSGVGPTPAYSYSACVVELEVDQETGDVRVNHVWIAHDGGTAINPLLVEGQVEGSIYMGLGEALMEESAFRVHGLHKIPSLLEYKSPTTLETPEITTILVQTNDAEGRSAPRRRAGPAPPGDSGCRHRGLRRGRRPDRRGADHAREDPEGPRPEGPGEGPRVGPERLPHVEFPEPTRVPPPWIDPGRPPARRVSREGAAPRMMRLPPFRYFAPRNLAERVAPPRRARRDAMVVAGGTDVYPNMKRLQMEPRRWSGSAASGSWPGSRATPGTASWWAPARR